MREDKKIINITTIFRPGESNEEHAVRQILVDREKRMDVGFAAFCNHLGMSPEQCYEKWDVMTEDEKELWIDAVTTNYLLKTPKTFPEQL